MELKIVYVGNDLGYWDKLQKRFSLNYEAISFEYLTIPTKDDFCAVETFIHLNKMKPQIIYLDLSQQTKAGLRLGKLINRNNEMRLISLVGLIDNKDTKKMLVKSVNASMRLTHIKSNEIQDVVYDPISLLDVNLAVMPTYIKSNVIENFEIQQPLRVGYVENNRFHVETNSYLEVGHIVDIDQHPLKDIMPSTKVFVEKFYDQNLYYNKRFAYDLEFIYIDDDYFVATNKNWLLYKELKNDPDKFNELGEIEKQDIKDDMERRKKLYLPTKKNIDKWMADHQGKVEPKKLKVMLVDYSLDIFLGLKGREDEFPYSLNVQTILKDDCYQVQRTMPHLIVFNQCEINTNEKLAQIISKIGSIEDYSPFLIITNSDKPTETLRTEFSYDHLISAGKGIDIDTIIRISNSLNDKHHISDAGTKVFFRHSDDESTIFLKRNVKVVGMTESILYFQSPIEIPMWTVFRAQSPIKMFLTVVPHKEGGEFSGVENCYRCLINGVGELEKAAIRKLINSTLGEDEDEKN